MKVNMAKVFQVKDAITGNVSNLSIQISCGNEEEVDGAKKILKEFNKDSLKEA
jgi:hypothetical protein